MNIREFITDTLDYLGKIAPKTSNRIDDAVVAVARENKFLINLLVNMVERRAEAGEHTLALVGPSHDETFQLTAQGVSIDKWVSLVGQIVSLYRMFRG